MDKHLTVVKDLIINLIGPEFLIVAREGTSKNKFFATDFGSDNFPKTIDEWVNSFILSILPLYIFLFLINNMPEKLHIEHTDQISKLARVCCSHGFVEL